MKLNIKTRLKDLDLSYIECYHLINKVGKNWSILDKIKLVKLYTKQDVSKVKVDDINKVFEIILKVLGSYQQKEIPLTLEIDGVDYELVTDYFKLPAGWFIDSEGADFEKIPELLPAFAYIEKGMKYAEIDENENIKNPLKDRAEVFKNNMTLSEYLDLTGFFLLKQKQYKIFYTLTQTKKQKNQRVKRGNGKTLYTLWLKSLTKIGTKLLN